MHESLTSFAVTSETSVVVEPVWLGANRPAVRGHDRVCGGSHDRISAGAAHHRIAAVGRGDGLGRRLGHRLASACCVGVSTGDLAAMGRHHKRRICRLRNWAHSLQHALPYKREDIEPLSLRMIQIPLSNPVPVQMNNLDQIYSLRYCR
jgi:hypothetical protein